jgi:hypothetical protein
VLRDPVSCRRFGCRHSLLGSSCARWGVEPSSRSADRRPAAAGPQRGCRVAHAQAATGQGACFTPGTVVRSRPANTLRPAPAALPRRSPYGPAGTSHRRGHLHETSTQVHSRSPITPGDRLPPKSRKPHAGAPADLLLARRPRVEREPLRLRPRAPHPAVTRDARRGGDRPSRTGPSTTPSASAEPPTVPPTCTHAPSRRT